MSQNNGLDYLVLKPAFVLKAEHKVAGFSSARQASSGSFAQFGKGFA
jgi:hypothetical protein